MKFVDALYIDVDVHICQFFISVTNYAMTVRVKYGPSVSKIVIPINPPPTPPLHTNPVCTSFISIVYLELIGEA